jgi:hypothetical protein
MSGRLTQLIIAIAATSGVAAAAGPADSGGGHWIGVIGGTAQLLVGVLFALLSITYGIRLVDGLIKGISLLEEVKNKNLGVSILAAGVVVAFATTVSSGIGHLSQGIAKLGELGLANSSAWAAVGMAVIAILVGFLAAVIGIIWAYGVLTRMMGRVAGLDVETSLKEGNTALGFLLGAAIYAIATVLSTGVSGISKALIGM